MDTTAVKARINIAMTRKLIAALDAYNGEGEADKNRRVLVMVTGTESTKRIVHGAIDPDHSTVCYASNQEAAIAMVESGNIPDVYVSDQDTAAFGSRMEDFGLSGAIQTLMVRPWEPEASAKAIGSRVAALVAAFD